MESYGTDAFGLNLPRINVDLSGENNEILSEPNTPSQLNTPGFGRDRSLRGSTAHTEHSESSLLKPPQTETDRSSTRFSRVFGEEEGQEALKPEPGSEKDFIVYDNKFAFSPGQLTKLLNPKSLGAYAALGGIRGLERGLQSNKRSGWSGGEMQSDVAGLHLAEKEEFKNMDIQSPCAEPSLRKNHLEQQTSETDDGLGGSAQTGYGRWQSLLSTYKRHLKTYEHATSLTYLGWPLSSRAHHPVGPIKSTLLWALCVLGGIPGAMGVPMDHGPSAKVSSWLIWPLEIWYITLMLAPYLITLIGIWFLLKTLLDACSKQKAPIGPKAPTAPETPTVSGALSFGAAFAYWAVNTIEKNPTGKEAIIMAVFVAFWTNFVAYSCRPVHDKRQYLLVVFFGGGAVTLLVSAMAFIAEGSKGAGDFFRQTGDIAPLMFSFCSIVACTLQATKDRSCDLRQTEEGRGQAHLGYYDVAMQTPFDSDSRRRDVFQELYQRGVRRFEREEDPHDAWRLAR